MATIYVPEHVRNIKRLNKDRIVIIGMHYPFKILQPLKKPMGREKELKEDSETRETQAEAGWEGERASVLPVWWAVIAKQTGQDWRLVLTSCSRTLFRTHGGWIRQSGTDKVMCEEGSRSISYTFITEWEIKALGNPESDILQQSSHCSNTTY